MKIPQMDSLIQHHSHWIYPVVINEHFSSIVRQIKYRNLLIPLKSQKMENIYGNKTFT